MVARCSSSHYQRLLDYRADRVHVLAGGRIEKSGGPNNAELEETGRREGRGERMTPDVGNGCSWNGTLLADTENVGLATNVTLGTLFNAKACLVVLHKDVYEENVHAARLCGKRY